jgi:hypothetical protein
MDEAAARRRTNGMGLTFLISYLLRTGALYCESSSLDGDQLPLCFCLRASWPSGIEHRQRPTRAGAGYHWQQGERASRCIHATCSAHSKMEPALDDCLHLRAHTATV